jgi:hypothetical protein
MRGKGSLLELVGVVALLTVVLLPSTRAGAIEAKPFGIEKFTLQTTRPRKVIEPRGYTVVNEPYAFTQAGGHPAGLTATFVFTHEKAERLKEPGHFEEVPTQDPKDIIVNIPPGLIGDPEAVPKCELTSLLDRSIQCPADTQIGMYRIRFAGGYSQELGPIYNGTPELGQTAEFALVVKGIDVSLIGRLTRTEKGYGIAVISKDISGLEILEAETTFWGVPAEPGLDWLRGLTCPRDEFFGYEPQCGNFSSGGNESTGGLVPVPFLSLPTDCTAGPEAATAHADSWEHPGHAEGGQYFGYVESEPATMPAVTGCDALSFKPRIESHPETLLADAPIGLTSDVIVPQTNQPEALATPHLRKAVVTLPLGMSVSPGSVNGIRACDASGPEGINFMGPESEQVALDGELQLAPGKCPPQSILGEAEAETPLLLSSVRGHVYLARPGCGGALPACTTQDALDGNLYKVYLELGGTGELGDAGVNIKVEGRVQANPATGQLTAIFDQNPQTPFSDLRIKLIGGPEASLANPAACGLAVTTSDFTPWSAPGLMQAGPLAGTFVAGTPDATPSSEYAVEGCATPPGLKPGFMAGTVSPQAAKFSSFTLDFSRVDREQYVKGIQVHMPPGLIGMLSSVTLCGSVEAEAGTCPAASQIGTTRVATGAGSAPFEIEGAVYLTGPYEGSPFGLSVVTHAVAGPFDLGLVVVRARIDVDREDSTLTVSTDETGPRALPQILFGVPLRLKRVTVNIDRPGFMFNPTNCKLQEITASVSGNGGAVAQVSSPFAAAGCRTLVFKPTFKAYASGRTSRARGASLDVTLTYPKNALGNDANVAKAKVSLPRQLPSRLSTLQKACPARVFDVNPAGCPAASIVGIARSRTPVLPVPVMGPVYFVSHGGEQFPSLVVVLQGDHVRVDLTGTTFISKSNITSSTFKTVPDVPVSSFELYLPEGRYSALAATAKLCELRSKLKMPTEFTAQNGTVFKQSTNIQVTGCPKRKTEGKGR